MFSDSPATVTSYLPLPLNSLACALLTSAGLSFFRLLPRVPEAGHILHIWTSSCWLIWVGQEDHLSFSLWSYRTIWPTHYFLSKELLGAISRRLPTFHLSSVLMCSGKEKTSLIDSKSGNLRTLSELFPNTVVLQMEQFISILWASISSSVKWSRHIVCHSKLPCGTKEMEQEKLFVDLCLT